jgi:hypothetical protein
MAFSLKKAPFFIRLFHWEYWPFAVVYGPILPFYFWYALRARSFFFFSTSNPFIKNAGFLMESKFEIDKIVPLQYRPPSLYFAPSSDLCIIQEQIKKQQFSYPLIIKPDIGGKGVGVKKVNTATQLSETIKKTPVPFIIQPYIAYPNEIGLFFVKIPGEDKGRITGIVRKEFLKVTGDGVSTILELLQKRGRTILQIPALKKLLLNDIYRIIPAGVTEILVPYGNHARGSLFLDDSHLISPKLEASFNKICAAINGFYYGRMDIKYNTMQELEEGKNFSIIELNGAGSEPTHIYDPKHSIFFAWKEIIRHWKFLWKISVKNKTTYKLSFMSRKEGMQMFADLKAYNKKCENAF